MAKVAAELRIPASLAETWDLYFDPTRWAEWVDEFRAIDSLRDGYPQVGGTLVWHSGPSGRGQVTETVLEHEQRSLHRIRYSDPSSEGEQTTRFRIEGEGTLVRLELSYSLVKGGVLSRPHRRSLHPHTDGGNARADPGGVAGRGRGAADGALVRAEIQRRRHGERGLTVCSTDGNFARFPGVRWENPLAEA